VSWPLVKLSEVCTLINGRAYSQGELLSKGKYEVLRVGNFFSNRDWYYSDLELPEEKYCDNGDLLYAWSASFGPRIWDGGKVIYHYHIWKVVIDEALVDKKYLFYALQYDVDSIKREQGTGSTMIHVTKSAMENRLVPLPPLPEQKRIAAILDTAEAIRRKRQQAIQLADDFLRAVFLDMFGDPVTNPKGWELLPFSAVGTLDRGKSKHRPRNDPALLGGTHPLIQTGEVANSRGYIKDYSATYSDLGLVQSKKWDAGTLCITIAANIAKTGILTFPACFPDSVVGFMPNKHVTVEYVQHWLGFLQKNLEENAPQAAQKNINLEILRALLIPVPPKSEQEKFSSMVAGILAIEGKIASSSDTLGNAFDALSQKAFSGQL
jgi:type I restriction enzyme, S subunit